MLLFRFHGSSRKLRRMTSSWQAVWPSPGRRSTRWSRTTVSTSTGLFMWNMVNTQSLPVSGTTLTTRTMPRERWLLTSRSLLTILTPVEDDLSVEYPGTQGYLKIWWHHIYSSKLTFILKVPWWGLIYCYCLLQSCLPRFRTFELLPNDCSFCLQLPSLPRSTAAIFMTWRTPPGPAGSSGATPPSPASSETWDSETEHHYIMTRHNPKQWNVVAGGCYSGQLQWSVYMMYNVGDDIWWPGGTPGRARPPCQWWGWPRVTPSPCTAQCGWPARQAVSWWHPALTARSGWGWGQWWVMGSLNYPWYSRL